MRVRVARVERRASVMAVVVLAGGAVSGCAGNGEGLDQNGRPDDAGPAPLVATFESIQENVFTPICTQCHVGAQAPVGLRLDAQSAYAMLVNTPSGEVPALKRVQPGNADASYLLQKLQGTAAVGSRMPLNNPALPQATIDVIRQWIANGAQRAVASNVPAKPQLLAISPGADETLASAPQELLLQASDELDVSRLTIDNVLIVRSGGDGSFAEGNEVQMPVAEIEVRSLAPTVIAIRMPTRAWLPDLYQLQVSGSGPMPLMDLAGTPLDGNADGTAGDDFLMQFTLQGAL